MTNVLRYAVIGLGSMGRHHVRNVRSLDGAELVALADPFGDKFGVAEGLPVYENVEQLLEHDIDAAVVAVPTAHHYQVAMALADAGVHTLVEKPLANTLEEAETMVKTFAEKNLVGAVGYVERCNPALLEMRKKIAEGLLGEVYQVSTRRQSPFPARISDVGVVKDLATHDIDLTAWVADSNYARISATTAHRAGREFEDMVSIAGELENGVIVNHLVNWLTPFKDRQTVVVGKNGALVAETVMGDLTYYENGVDPIEWDQVSNFRGVSEGTVTRYALNKREPLAVEHENFRDAILGESRKIVTMAEALNTMKVVDSVLESASSRRLMEMNL